MELDLGSREFRAAPFPFYARLRRESPVVRARLPGGQPAWLITRYEDVAAGLVDKRLVKDRSQALTPEQARRQPWVPGMFRPLTRNMLDLDPPDHTRLRALVQKAFTPRLVEEMRPRIERLTEELLDRAEERGGTLDLIRDYALPLPTTIIAEILGVPSDDRRKFHRWSSVVVAADPSLSSTLRATPAVFAFLRYIRRLVRARRADPRDDLVSALVQAEEAGEKMNEDELLAMIFLLLIAGHETTVNLIGNGALALLEHPVEWERLREDPRLLATGIEELLRYDGPVALATERYAREDLELAGARIARGELVHAVLASANRDERVFVDPDRLDVARDPNRHLAFGLGIHYCLGAPLARLEARIAFETLLRRGPRFRLATPRARLEWRRSIVLRGLEALPVFLA